MRARGTGSSLGSIYRVESAGGGGGGGAYVPALVSTSESAFANAAMRVRHTWPRLRATPGSPHYTRGSTPLASHRRRERAAASTR